MAFARSAIRGARLVRTSCLTSGRRHASTYNTEIAGLSEEQAEVRHHTVVTSILADRCHFFSSGMRFPSSHNVKLLRGLQRSTEPTPFRWSVLCSCISHSVSTQLAGRLGETRKHGLARRNGIPQLRGSGFGIFPSCLGDGRAFASVWLNRTVLWCTLKPLREPNPSSWHGGTEIEIPP